MLWCKILKRTVNSFRKADDGEWFHPAEWTVVSVQEEATSSMTMASCCCCYQPITKNLFLQRISILLKKSNAPEEMTTWKPRDAAAAAAEVGRKRAKLYFDGDCCNSIHFTTGFSQLEFQFRRLQFILNWFLCCVAFFSKTKMSRGF